MSDERPTLGADPLRPPPADVAGDPILDGYGAGDPGTAAEPAGEAAGVPVGPEEVTQLLVGFFDGLAQLRGPHWHAEPAEFAMAAPPLARELNKPDTALAAWLAAHGDTLLIVVGLGAVVVPRAMVEYQVMKYRREQLRAEQEAAPDGQPDDPYRYTYPGAGADAARAAAPAPGGGPGNGVQPDGVERPPGTRPSDPGDVAAAVGSILG